MARKFLFAFAALIVLVLLSGIAWSLFSERMIRAAMVPGAAFVEQRPIATNAYDDKSMWFARPDIANNPALWRPDGFVDTTTTKSAAIFFVHPTSYLDRRAWNAPLDDAASQELARTFLRGQASVFNGVGDIWAPRYRQATFGSFLTTQPEATRALDAAYGDVTRAFDVFIAAQPGDRPIIVAGHSQGALHLMRLLREKIAGRPLAARIVAAYVIGWPVSIDHDLPSLGLPGCSTADQAGCVLSWQSFATPADPKQIVEAYDATIGLDGKARRGSTMLCVNPLTGTRGASIDARANVGTLIPRLDLKQADLVAGRVPAGCDPRGFLMIGPPPEGITAYVLPGNNYHVFDYSLFWANVRRDAARRLATFRN